MFITCVAVLAAAAAGLALRSEYERRHFVTDHYEIISDKIKDSEKNFVFLSDLHSNEFGEKNKLLIDEIDRIHPDGILIGGDMMVSREECDLRVTENLVRELASRYPVYYANGNHEERIRRERTVYGNLYDEFREILSEAGVIYLSDESVIVGDDIRITGCNMKEIYYRHRFTIPELPEDELERHAGKADGNRYQILMLHSPLFFKNCREWGADLTLSGHFHGGTIRLPLLGGVMTPQYQFFLPWCAGRFEREGKTMLVSRGLGTHSINIRLNDRSQLMWITLKGREKGGGKEDKVAMKNHLCYTIR